MNQSDNKNYFREDLIRVLYDSIPDLILVCYFNYGRVLSNFFLANKSAIEILGYESNEFKNLNPLSIIFSNNECKLIDVLNELEQKNQAYFDSNILRKNGERISVEVTSQLINYNGESIVVFDCRPIEKYKSREEIFQLNEKLRKLAARFQLIREDERKSIAREIHDELGQNLTAIKILLSMLKKNILQDDLLNQINEIIKICDSTINSIQNITSKLRPELLDELGLIPAIEWQLKKFFEQTKIEYILNIPDEVIHLNSEKETALFRIFQEALTNVARHSNASRVRVSITIDDRNLIMEIYDNGKGITQNQINNPNSLGILGMKERSMLLGGEFIIKSTMNSGTIVRVKIPIEESL